ncbi:MAG: prolyl oligopeptidase family protein [Thermoanaerobaculia bacterium]
MKYARTTVVSASLLCAVPALAATQPGTPKIPVSDTYHGVRVVDPYRWLENGDDPKVKAWSDAQSARARAYLDNVPGTQALRARVEHLLTARPASITRLVPRAGRFFAVCRDPARKQQPWIALLPSLTSTEEMRTLVDPNVIDPTGHTAFDWFVPSPDGTKLAVSLSEGGSEAGTLHVYDVATARETGDVIPRVQVGTGGGSVTWTADSNGLWYTRYPHEGERPGEDLDFYQQVFFHALGTPPAQDRYSMGKELPRIAEISLRASEDGRLHLALVENGDSGDYAVYFLPDGATAWQSLSTFADGLIEACFGRDGAIWAISKKGAPRRRVLRIPVHNPSLAAARTVLDQRAGVIEAIEPARSRLYTIEALGGKSRVRSYDFEGNLVEELPTPTVSAAAELKRLDGDQVLYGVTTFLHPYAGYVYDPAKKLSTPTVVGRPPVADFSDAEVLEESALSKDGTRVPMFILQPKGTRRDGRNPVILTGYGGFGISQTPTYSDLAHVYTERGVVLVFALLRGGGEFGEEWHDAGRLTHKQNVFDDFLACARRLIELKVTNPGRLAIEGGSNGGLLMGAALTQAPKLFRAVVSHVGIYDMLRVETSANGQFNTVEFGTVKVPEQFKALYAYSPYHHVKDKTRYPAILMPTGANDPRVDPMQSRKMVARLQAADPKATVLLRTSGSTGHGGIGAGVKDLVSLVTDVDAFLLHELGVTPSNVLRVPPATH